MLDVLIIGCGNIAGGFDATRLGTSTTFSHAGAYVTQGDFALRCCVDPNEVRRAAFQKRWGVQQGYSCIEEVIHQGLTFDVISICSPTQFHADHLRKSVALKPRLVFCEKPMTASLDDSKEISVIYREAGIHLMVNYTRRWDECVQTFRKELNCGLWGKVRSANGIYNKGLYNNGSHMLDLLIFLLGSMTVINTGPGNADKWDNDPSIPVMLLSVEGVTVTLNCGHAEDYSLFELEIVTERGAIKMLNGGFHWQVRRVGPSQIFPGYQMLNAPMMQLGGIGEAFLASVNEIVKVVTAGGKPSCGAEEAVNVQALCEEIRFSALQNS